MELTQEQNEICESEGNIIIDAVSGSGKTSTLVEYAKKRPSKRPKSHSYSVIIG